MRVVIDFLFDLLMVEVLVLWIGCIAVLAYRAINKRD